MSKQLHAPITSARALTASGRRPGWVTWGAALVLLMTAATLTAHDDSLPGNGQVPLHARDAMRANLAGALGIDLGRVSVKATRGERLGPEGRGEAITVHAVALIVAAGTDS